MVILSTGPFSLIPIFFIQETFSVGVQLLITIAANTNNIVFIFYVSLLQQNGFSFYKSNFSFYKKKYQVFYMILNYYRNYQKFHCYQNSYCYAYNSSHYTFYALQYLFCTHIYRCKNYDDLSYLSILLKGRTSLTKINSIVS